MEFDGTEFGDCTACGKAPRVKDFRTRSIDLPNWLSATCPSCGRSCGVTWAGCIGRSLERAASLLAERWNGR